MDKVKDRLMTVLLCYNFLQKKKNKNLFLFSSIIYLTFISRFDIEPKQIPFSATDENGTSTRSDKNDILTILLFYRTIFYNAIAIFIYLYCNFGTQNIVISSLLSFFTIRFFFRIVPDNSFIFPFLSFVSG